jgi:hypothetical protein
MEVFTSSAPSPRCRAPPERPPRWLPHLHPSAELIPASDNNPPNIHVSHLPADFTTYTGTPPRFDTIISAACRGNVLRMAHPRNRACLWPAITPPEKYDCQHSHGERGVVITTAVVRPPGQPREDRRSSSKGSPHCASYCAHRPAREKVTHDCSHLRRTRAFAKVVKRSCCHGPSG